MTLSIHALALDWPAVKAAAESGGWSVPALAPVWVASEPYSCAELEAEVLAAAADDRGWARFQSAAWDGRVWRGDKAKPGRLIWAEWTHGAASFRATPAHDEPGVLHARRFTEAATATAGHDEVLAQHTRLLGHLAGRDLLYTVYWAGAGKDGARVRRLFSRFTGFSGRPTP